MAGGSRSLVLLHALVLISVYIASSLGVGEGKVIVRCIERERRALLTFKQGLVDPYNVLSSWGADQEEDCCQWTGIGCSNKTGRVIMLDLNGPSLSDTIPSPLGGKISPSLLELHDLNYLDLSYNDLSGTHIPNFIGSLTKLRYLSLQDAFLSGEIPYQMRNLSNLRYLDLSFNSDLHVNKLEWLSRLPSLQFLDMSFVDLRNAIDWLEAVTSAPSLEELHLRGCDLSHATPSSLSVINSSASLAILDLAHNHFTSSTFHWLSNLPSLQSLDISYVNLCNTTEWLEAVTNSPSLTELNLNNCSLSDPVPSSSQVVNSSTSLAILHLSHNYFTSSIFDWLFNVSSSLVEVELSGNQIRGHIPEAFQSMTSLAQLDLSDNKLEGRIPKSFGNLCNLQTLDLSGGNNISGQFSEIVHHLSNCSSSTLEVLGLRDNWVSGSVPDLTVFSSLRVLDLTHNQLKGTVSPGIGNLTQLQTLRLGYNSLQGTISEAHFLHLSKLIYLGLPFNSLFLNLSSDWSPPFQLQNIWLDSCKVGPRFPAWLRNQKKVLELSIPSAGISDAIPDWLCDLNSITYINLSGNEIRGVLPNLSSCFGNFPQINFSSNHLEGHIPQFPSAVSKVDLSKNMFSGPISLLCASESLEHINLSDNLLSGELPECLMNLKNLTILNLPNNNLSGKIPNSMDSLVHIEVLHLRNNSFTGKLPSSLKNCTKLVTIDLGENRLSGTVPAWIGESLSNLIVLSLRSNALYGTIPWELCRLSYIQIFDLSGNNISGTIPNCLNNFTAMAQTNSSMSTTTYSYTLGNITYLHFADYIEHAVLFWKGSEHVYTTTLSLVRTIDLSSNKLMGEIPGEIMDLVGLIGLNLSRNCLTGVINQKIGQLKKLDFLDLSRNPLSGGIPTSLSQLSYLGVLDLSYNELAGRIPTGTQLQSFDASSYVGNSGLWGPPLTVEHPTHGRNNVSTEEDEDDDKLITFDFILSMGLGFALGFWGVCGTLLLNSSLRYTYFKLLDNIKDWLYMTIAVNKAKLKRWWLHR